jgi:hypothetical protein
MVVGPFAYNAFDHVQSNPVEIGDLTKRDIGMEPRRSAAGLRLRSLTCVRSLEWCLEMDMIQDATLRFAVIAISYTSFGTGSGVYVRPHRTDSVHAAREKGHAASG